MKIDFYAVGLINMSACASKEASKDQIEKEANKQHPTGITHKWKISEDKTFKTGEIIPHQCETIKSNQHWLLNC